MNCEIHTPDSFKPDDTYPGTNSIWGWASHKMSLVAVQIKFFAPTENQTTIPSVIIPVYLQQ
jgi:hypothetical protein